MNEFNIYKNRANMYNNKKMHIYAKGYFSKLFLNKSLYILSSLYDKMDVPFKKLKLKNYTSILKQDLNNRLKSRTRQ